tara:strand:+ start:779 stop:1603 length:825 start_codon:yes stop_codon:yes gene_type:complete
MNIKTYEPKNIILKKYIEYYYSTTVDNQSYIAFPHYTLPVSFIKNASAEIIKNEVLLSRDSNTELKIITTNKFIKPLKIKNSGKINDFCIIFKPYGLVQFLNEFLDWNNPKEVYIINLFDDFLLKAPAFFELEGDCKIEYLETYLCSNLKEKKGTELIIKALKIIREEDNISIANLSKRCNCHPKKLYRYFKKICGESPKTFSKIIQFRKALEKLKEMDPSLNLTNIAYDSNYYDQPAFNNAFKKLTGENPNKFFKNVREHSQKKIYFKDGKNK